MVDRPACRFKDPLGQALTIVSLTFFILFYQNVSNLNQPRHQFEVEAGVFTQYAESSGQPEADIRKTAPVRPNRFDNGAAEPFINLRAPEHATSADGAGAQWAERELHAYFAPYESDLIASVNSKLNRLFQTQDAERASAQNSVSKPYESPEKYRPNRVQMTTATELKIDFNGNTSLFCNAAGGGGKFRLARPLNSRTDIDISHDTAERRNSINLSISW